MRVSKFMLDANMCSGRLQRALGDSGTPVESIMERLAEHEVFAMEPDRIDGRTFDIRRLGVTDDMKLIIEIRQQWTSRRAIVEGLRTAAILILLAGIVAVSFWIGHDAGIADSIQLPTL